jgi:hypothetical protein
MDVFHGLTNISVLLVYCGLAGVWGTLLGRSLSNRIYIHLSVIFGVALFLPSSIWLPWVGLAKLGAWALALGLVILFATQPESLPDWVWSHRFGLLYFGSMMLLTVIWALFLHQTMQWVGLGLSALLMVLLISMRTITEIGKPRKNGARQNHRV